MFRVSVGVEGANAAADLLEQTVKRHERSVEPLWRQLADAWKRSLGENISRGGRPPFVPLSATTLKLRARRGISGSPLIASGRLKSSVEVLALSGDRLEVGSRLEIARFHEFGFTTGAGAMIPEKGVPARPWIVLEPRTLEETFQRIDQFFLEDR